MVKSCAPPPLWVLLRRLNAAQPEKMVASAICQNADAWRDGTCDIAILPFPLEGAKPFMQEQLFVSVPPDHELAGQKALTFAAINGFNFLPRTEPGFWDTLCREKCPPLNFWYKRTPLCSMSWYVPPPCPALPRTTASTITSAIQTGSISP